MKRRGTALWLSVVALVVAVVVGSVLVFHQGRLDVAPADQLIPEDAGAMLFGSGHVVAADSVQREFGLPLTRDSASRYWQFRRGDGLEVNVWRLASPLVARLYTEHLGSSLCYWACNPEAHQLDWVPGSAADYSATYCFPTPRQKSDEDKCLAMSWVAVYGQYVVAVSYDGSSRLGRGTHGWPTSRLIDLLKHVNQQVEAQIGVPS